MNIKNKIDLILETDTTDELQPSLYKKDWEAFIKKVKLNYLDLDQIADKFSFENYELIHKSVSPKMLFNQNQDLFVDVLNRFSGISLTKDFLEKSI